MKGQGNRFKNPIFFPHLPDSVEIEKGVAKLKEEIEKIQKGDGFFVSIESDRFEYTIFSKSLKDSCRSLIFSDRYWKNLEGEGRWVEGGFFSYHEGIDGSPDKFMVINSNENSSSEIFEIRDKEAEKKLMEEKDAERHKKLTNKDDEELKNNQTLTASEKQARLQENQKKLDELTYNESSPPSNFNDNFSVVWVIGGGILVVVMRLVLLLSY